MKIPITQSEAWQNLQIALGENCFFKKEPDYQYLAILKSTPVGNYLYLPYGPVAENKDGFKQALKSLNNLARDKSAIFIRIEPPDPEFTKIFPKTTQKTKDLNPKETWLLDLKGNEDDFKKRLPSRLLRYYRNAAKNGLEITTSKDPADIHYLLDLQKALAREKGINTFSEDYLKTELNQPFATLYLVKQHSPEDKEGLPLSVTRAGDGPGGGPPLSVSEVGEDKVRQDPPEENLSGNIIAAGLVFDDNTTRYNLQGAQSEEGKKLHATGILTIQLILDAREKGLEIFDFWGIAPEGAPDSHPWAGFTNFKKTFAGYQVDHAGTYDLVISPAKYRLYQAMRKLNRFIRK